MQIGKFKLVFFTRAARLMTDRAYMSIGEVLALLQSEFPDVTISKIRFLESQGLIDPERTPSGYRKFYPADIERLRWILREQRENFLPLKVIKDRLDSGEPLGDSEPTVAVPTVPSPGSVGDEASELSIDAEEPVPSWLPKPPRPGPPAPPPARPAPTPGVDGAAARGSGLHVRRDPRGERAQRRAAQGGRELRAPCRPGGRPRDVLRRRRARRREARRAVPAVRRRSPASAHVPHERRARGGLRRERRDATREATQPSGSRAGDRDRRDVAPARRQHEGDDAPAGAPRLLKPLTRCGHACSSTARRCGRSSAGSVERSPMRTAATATAANDVVLVASAAGERRVPRRPRARAHDRLRGGLPRGVVVRRGARAASGCSRTSTSTSPAATWCSWRTSSTPG